jgi:Tfp pilus assembly protein PilP
MRVAKFWRILMLLALPVIPAACALAQDHPNVQPSRVRDQLNQQTPGASQPQPAAPAKAPAPPKVPAQTPANAKQQAKPAAKAPSPKTAAKRPVEKPAEQKPSGPRRDPFETLLNNDKPSNGPPQNLPPGKAGLMVGTLRIDGIVRGTGGMIAIVSNPQQRVYFLREGDKLYDGSIEHITLEAITFHEFGKDAFGKPLEREVTRRLYPSPGEQQ